MKLSCLTNRPWLIPYSNGTLETERPWLHARLTHHIAACESCRREAVRLAATDSVLRGYAAKSRLDHRQTDLTGAPTARGKALTPLSSRVLASIQSDERFHHSARWSPNALSFATAALGAVVFVLILNPNGAFSNFRGMFGHHNPPAVAPGKPGMPGVPYYPPSAGNPSIMTAPISNSVTINGDGAGDASQGSASHGVQQSAPQIIAPRIATDSFTSPPRSSTVDQPAAPVPTYDETSAQAASNSPSDTGGTSDSPQTAPTSTPVINSVADSADSHPVGSAMTDYATSSRSDGAGQPDHSLVSGRDSGDSALPPAPPLGDSAQAKTAPKPAK